jgi:4-hydroxy-4-methyl-2-oxoglutarate aldolase
MSVGTSLSSCDVSDACDELGIEPVRTGALRPLWHDCSPLAGPVRSVRLEPSVGTASPMADLLAFLADSEGCVVCIDLGARADVQCWGTVLAAAAHHFGVKGALVNGAARDIEGLRALGLPCYARGVYPGAMRGRLRIVATDEPVELDGEAVVAGSFAVVDSSGAVFLPVKSLAAVQTRAAERADQERHQLRSIESGGDPRTVLGGGDEAGQP